MMTFPIHGKIKFMFQATNQIIHIYNIIYIYIYSDIIKSQRLSAPFFTICAKGLMDLYTSTPKLGMGMMIAG